MISRSLSEVMLAEGKRAEELGLHLTQFNSGSPNNPSNGFRLFFGTHERDFFDIDDDHFLTHLPNDTMLRAWLEGFTACTILNLGHIP